MLWEKESRKKDALYLDMFNIVGGNSVLSQALDDIRCNPNDSTLNKDNAMSLVNRKFGNDQFGKKNWTDAMELYNASLRYAENGSENISLAYANRSACFLKMKRYNECLVDIELAKEAGYPAELMPKLDRRKEDCLKLIEEDAPACSKFDVKLSFESNEQFPSMANVLKVDQDADGKVGLFATEDIAVGQTIVKEKAFVACVLSRYGWKCNICLKEYANFVPCKNCTLAMFCNDKCRSDALHDYECGSQIYGTSEESGFITRVVRSCVLVIDMFPSADELMKFVEQVVKSDRNQVPENLSSAKSQYEAFLKLPIQSDPNLLENNLCLAFEAHKILSNISKMKSVFKLEKYRRFWMHLITHNFLVLNFNSTIAHFANSAVGSPWSSSTTGLTLGYLKHSCAPNVLVATFHGNTVIITVRPVKKGQQIIHSFLLRTLKLPNDQRKRMLWEERMIVCKCERCDGATASMEQREQIIYDPDFQFVANNQSTMMMRGDDKNTQTMINKCESVLQKYGQVPWCDEIGNIVDAYIMLIYFWCRGITSSLTVIQTG